MAKGKKKKSTVEDLVSSEKPMLEFVFDETPLFAMAAHPSKSLLYLGLSNGFVYCYDYDAEQLTQDAKNRKKDKAKEEDDDKDLRILVGDDKKPGLKIQWKTKRHRGSLRGLALDSSGEFVYSLGADNIIKKANSETGQVVTKGQLPPGWEPSTKLIVTDKVVVIGNEVGSVLILDPHSLRLKNRIDKIHFGDSINDIIQFCKRSVYKFISLGQTTLAYWDCNNTNGEDREKILVSDDQEDEILCGAFVDQDTGDTLVCGMGEGILTVWKPEKNDLEDQMSRIKINKGESIDCIVPTLQDDNGVWCGCSDGKVYRVDTKRSKIVEVRLHSAMGEDEVTFLDLDCSYRLISGGMESLKVWPETGETKESESESEDISSESDDNLSDSEDDSDSTDSSDNGEETLTGLSKEELLAELDKDLEQPQQPAKKKQKTKPARKTDESSHGIVRFDDL